MKVCIKRSGKWKRIRKKWRESNLKTAHVTFTKCKNTTIDRFEMATDTNCKYTDTNFFRDICKDSTKHRLHFDSFR